MAQANTHKTGLAVFTYLNTGTYAKPVWSELKRVADETLTLDKNTAEIKNRESIYRREIGATRGYEGNLTFHEKKNAADTDFDKLFDSWQNDTAIEVAFMDGDIATTGSKGFRIGMFVTKMDQRRQLEDLVEWSVDFMLTEYDDGGTLVDPERYEVP